MCLLDSEMKPSQQLDYGHCGILEESVIPGLQLQQQSNHYPNTDLGVDLSEYSIWTSEQ